MSSNNQKHGTAYVVAKLLPSILCITVTLFAGVAAAMAWFTMNSQVEAKGMAVAIDVSDSYLVIADTPENLFDATAADTSITFTGGKKKYVPVTHDDNEGGTYRLVYVMNGDAIDPDTGLGEPEFLPVESDDAGSNAVYFVDFTVYVGAIHNKLEHSDLLVSWQNGTVSAAETDMQKSASVDFYCNGNFIDTLHLNANEPIKLLNDTTIPHVKDNEPIVVLMRCYYDGGLTYLSDGQSVAYVRTGLVEASDVNLGIRFDAVESGG